MRIIALLMASYLLAGCSPKSSYGFRLPDGSADAGRDAFVALQCTACHRLAGADSNQDGGPSVVIGGEVSRIQTYGELVTSIINPSHKVARHLIDPSFVVNGKSAMETVELNRTMTVQQLIDLVAYLQPHYKVAVPDYNPYLMIHQ